MRFPSPEDAYHSAGQCNAGTLRNLVCCHSLLPGPTDFLHVHPGIAAMVSHSEREVEMSLVHDRLVDEAGVMDSSSRG
jgi:hypothetical protein